MYLTRILYHKSYSNSFHFKKGDHVQRCYIPDRLLLVQDWEFIDVWQGPAFRDRTGLALNDLIRQLKSQWTQNISRAILSVLELCEIGVNNHKKRDLSVTEKY